VVTKICKEFKILTVLTVLLGPSSNQVEIRAYSDDQSLVLKSHGQILLGQTTAEIQIRD